LISQKCFVSGVVTPPPLAAEIHFRVERQFPKTANCPSSPPPHDREKSQKSLSAARDLRGRSEAILRGAPTPAEIEVTR